MEEKSRQTDMQHLKEMAVDQFVRRRRYASQIEKIDNAGLHAGQPMYFYCKACGIPTEVLPEDYLFQPFQHCSQCVGMQEQGWLEEAKSRRD